MFIELKKLWKFKLTHYAGNPAKAAGSLR